jgi:tetratricopeptide (TPR) repeat protein
MQKIIALLLLLVLILLTGFRNPPGAERFMEQGDNAVSEGDPGLGLEYYSRAIRMKPDNASFYLTRGFLLLKLNRTEEGINDLGEYIRILPKVSQGYMSRGMAYSQLNREKEADEDFAMACRLGDAGGCSFAGIGR